MASEDQNDPQLVADLLREEIHEVLSASPDEVRARAAARKALDTEIELLAAYREELQTAAHETGDYDPSTTRNLSEAQLDAEMERNALPPDEH